MRPAELAALLDLAERPRDSGWSLRAALVRYGQPEPQRASDLMELVRRIESALRPNAKVLERDGPAVWAAVQGAGAADGNERLVALLGAMAVLDGVSEQLSVWAVTASTEARPDRAVDAAIASVTKQLEGLGIEREERPRPPGARSRG